jgi:hypothetical protein
VSVAYPRGSLRSRTGECDRSVFQTDGAVLERHRHRVCGSNNQGQFESGVRHVGVVQEEESLPCPLITREIQQPTTVVGGLLILTLAWRLSKRSGSAHDPK